MSNEQQSQQLSKRVGEELDGLFGLVNNAGMMEKAAGVRRLALGSD